MSTGILFNWNMVYFSIVIYKNGDFVDDGLTVEDVNKECNVIKIINRSML